MQKIISKLSRYRIVPAFTVIGIVLISTFIFWLPFLLRSTSWFGLNIPSSNFLYIYRHYDGPFYAVVAKTLYNPLQIEKFILDISYNTKYFAAHLPLYPLLVRIFSPIFNYSKATIFVNVLSSVALGLFFYRFIKELKISRSPIILTFVFLMLPRFLIIRSIGAPESLFMLMILMSLYFFEKEKYLLAGVFGGLATMTKTPGVLLFPAYILVFLEQAFRHSGERSDSRIQQRFRTSRNDIKKLSILLIPFGLLFVFLFYQIQYKDFFAYFHSGDNIHLVSPFSVFNSPNRWVGDAWLEDILFYFFLYLSTVIFLQGSKYRTLFYFSAVFFIAIIFIQHRDIARYSLPLWPMACIALEKFFTSKKFLLAFVILMPAIYLYAWNFSLQNIMPVSDWTSFFSK